MDKVNYLNPQKKKKKGRITIFVALGVFAFFVLGFLFINSTTSLFNINEKEGQKTLQGFIDLKKQDKTETAIKKYYSSLTNSYDSEARWYPTQELDLTNQPQIMGVSAILVDINTGQILYEKNSKEQKPIASLIKVMTAIVALEHANPDTLITVSRNAANIGENSMGISTGEIYTLEELLHGLILHSGNDAAYAIAEGVAGDVDTFVEWMNIKGAELGLQNSYFADPSGLNDQSYSTPEDLTRLSRYALKHKTIVDVAQKVEYNLNATKDHKFLPMYNQTNLLTTYPGVKGLKTGYTEEAGLCLITYAENNGVEVIGVVLNSIDRKGDMIRMLDYGFATKGTYIEHQLLDY